MRPTGGLPLEARERDDRSAQRVCSITVRAELEEALESARDEFKKGVADEGHVHFSVDAFGAVGFYFADGTFRWDEPYRVIRFEGNLRLVNVAEVHFDDCPLLELPN